MGTGMALAVGICYWSDFLPNYGLTMANKCCRLSMGLSVSGLGSNRPPACLTNAIDSIRTAGLGIRSFALCSFAQNRTF